nr:NtaA/DmoA family FMN-dependent monooxygenase [Nakamurella leprariae]
MTAGERTDERQMILGIMAGGGGSHRAAWRRPQSNVENAYGLKFYQDVAQELERAKVHFIFFADSVHYDEKLVEVRALRFLEAITLAAGVMGSTERLGLAFTASTTFSAPYTIARQLASLDHLSGGRAGWNIVTSFAGAEHYHGDGLPPHSVRHAKALEFMDIVTYLWDSWDPDALKRDRVSGRWADPTQIHPRRFTGEFFDVSGPLNMPSPPQGRPVLFQAGTSDSGKNLAAAHADAVYTVVPTLAEAQAYYADLKSRTAARGRDPESIKMLSGCIPIVGETEREAQEILAELNSLINFESGLRELKGILVGVPVDDFELDDVIPAEKFPPIASVQTMQSRYEVYRTMSLERGWSIRRMIEHDAFGGGHFTPVGSAAKVADMLEERFRQRGCDGYLFMGAYAPEGTQRICRLLVPELQERGLFRTEYQGTTLRENMGLPEITAAQREASRAKLGPRPRCAQPPRCTPAGPAGSWIRQARRCSCGDGGGPTRSRTARSVLQEHLLDLRRIDRDRQGQHQQHPGLPRRVVPGRDDPADRQTVPGGDPAGRDPRGLHHHDAGCDRAVQRCVLDRRTGRAGTGGDDPPRPGGDQGVDLRRLGPVVTDHDVDPGQRSSRGDAEHAVHRVPVLRPVVEHHLAVHVDQSQRADDGAAERLHLGRGGLADGPGLVDLVVHHHQHTAAA